MSVKVECPCGQTIGLANAAGRGQVPYPALLLSE